LKIPPPGKLSAVGGGTLGRVSRAGQTGGECPGAKTSGTDGSVHAARWDPVLRRKTLGALGRSRQSPRFRGFPQRPGRLSRSRTRVAADGVAARPAAPSDPRHLCYKERCVSGRAASTNDV
jgi:hypothetical protein